MSDPGYMTRGCHRHDLPGMNESCPECLFEEVISRGAELSTLRARCEAAERERDAAGAALTFKVNEIRGLMEDAEKERAEWSAAVMTNLGILSVPTLCAWCGLPAEGEGAIREHIATCKSNPAVQRALAAERSRDEAEAQARRIDDMAMGWKRERDEAREALRGLIEEVEWHDLTGTAVTAARRVLSGEKEGDK